MNKKIILIITIFGSFFAMAKYINIAMPESEINIKMNDYINIIKNNEKLRPFKKSKIKNEYSIYCDYDKGVTRQDLIKMIDNGENVSEVCTSNIEDFRELFYPERDGATEYTIKFNQDISKWDVSKGKNFSSMFSEAIYFNQDISMWDVSSGKNFNMMFLGAKSFNKPLGNWDVSNGVYFSSFFFDAKSFNQDIHLWDVEKSKESEDFFKGSALVSVNIPSDFSGFYQDSDSDGVPDNEEVYNETDPYDANSK